MASAYGLNWYIRLDHLNLSETNLPTCYYSDDDPEETIDAYAELAIMTSIESLNDSPGCLGD